MEMRAVPIYLRVSGVLVSLEGLTQELALGKSQLSAGYFKAYLGILKERKQAHLSGHPKHVQPGLYHTVCERPCSSQGLNVSFCSQSP